MVIRTSFMFAVPEAKSISRFDRIWIMVYMFTEVSDPDFRIIAYEGLVCELHLEFVVN